MSRKFWTIEMCVEYAKSRNTEILQDFYKNDSEKIAFNCLVCGNNFNMKWNHFYHGGSGCPYCAGKIKNTIEKCEGIALENGYTILSKVYKNAHVKLKFIHNECGFKFFMDWTSFFNRGSRCPRCMKRAKPTVKEMSKLCKERGYKLLSKEYSLKEKLEFQHISCGYIFNVVWNNFQQGHGCPKCKRSSMERIAEEFIMKNGFKRGRDYFINFRFPDCRDKQSLPFDFYFPNHNIICELQGQQHYELNNDYWRSKVDLKDRQKKDKIKKDYALNNGYIFLEIPYWEKENIESILTTELNLK